MRAIKNKINMLMNKSIWKSYSSKCIKLRFEVDERVDPINIRADLVEIINKKIKHEGCKR